MVRPQTLPHRAEAENAVLGGILLGGSDAMSDALELVTESDFYQPRAQAVFRAMRIVRESGDPIDVVTVETQLRKTGELELVGGIEGIARLDRYATANNVKAHAELVKESAQVRNMVVASREIAEEGMSEVEDVGDFVARSQAKFRAASEAREQGTYRSAKDVMLETMTGIIDRKKRGNDTFTGVPSGLVGLDSLTNGLQPTDLIILAARPSMGKTAVALALAMNAAVCRPKHYRLDPRERPPQFPVLFFSLEMGASQLMERCLASESGVKFGDLRSTAAFMGGDLRSVIQAGQRIADAPFYIDDTAAPSILEIRARARRWRDDRAIFPDPDPDDPSGNHQQLGLVMVDYLQLARGGKANYGSREQEISEISRGLKAMAKDLKVPVVALSQLNRAVDSRSDHRPQLSDLRESGAIEQDADVIMFIYREERYLAPDAPEEKRIAAANKAEIIIGKQRNGPLGTAHLHFEKDRQQFRDLARDEMEGAW